MNDVRVDVALIKELRDQTSASLNDIRDALMLAKGDKEKALQALKAKGKSIAEKKSSRSTKEGIVEAYIHSNRKVGVLLELRCETDFVAQNVEFQKLAKELALQIAATSPRYIRAQDIPHEVKEEERKLFAEQLQGINKPANIVEEILEGKLQKRWAEICLLLQPHIRNEDITVQDLLTEYIAKLGENIEIAQFIRYSI